MPRVDVVDEIVKWVIKEKGKSFSRGYYLGVCLGSLSSLFLYLALSWVIPEENRRAVYLFSLIVFQFWALFMCYIYGNEDK